MIVEPASHPQFLSNTYLVADHEGGPAFFVDAGGPVGSLIEAAERLELTPTHVLLTHHHFDHVCEVGVLRERWPQLEVLISPLERDMLAAGGTDAGAVVTGTVEAGQTLQLGTLEVRPLYTPGHTAGMLSFLVGDRFEIADAAAAASTGALHERRPGRIHRRGGGRVHGRHAVQELGRRGQGARTHHLHRSEGLDHGDADGAAARHGHLSRATPTRARSRRSGSSNPFIRIWRGLDAQGAEPCTALGEPATLVLLGDDYDGGKKAWVRWQDGSDDIVPGSQVERAA